MKTPNTLIPEDFENPHLPLSIDANMNNIPDEDELQSCCNVTSDKRLLIFIVQTVITFMILTFCLIKLSNEDLSCDVSNMYMSMLSIVLGFWLSKVSH